MNNDIKRSSWSFFRSNEDSSTWEDLTDRLSFWGGSWEDMLKKIAAADAPAKIVEFWNHVFSSRTHVSAYRLWPYPLTHQLQQSLEEIHRLFGEDAFPESEKIIDDMMEADEKLSWHWYWESVNDCEYMVRIQLTYSKNYEVAIVFCDTFHSMTKVIAEAKALIP